jgi:ribosomal protein S8
LDSRRSIQFAGLGSDIFRKFTVNNNLPRVPINLENIVRKLNLTDGNKTNLKATIIANVLEPLKMQGFISSYEKTQSLHGTKYFVHRDFDDPLVDESTNQ